jgi:hypothetical protein
MEEKEEREEREEKQGRRGSHELGGDETTGEGRSYPAKDLSRP